MIGVVQIYVNLLDCCVPIIVFKMNLFGIFGINRVFSRFAFGL